MGRINRLQNAKKRFILLVNEVVMEWVWSFQMWSVLESIGCGIRSAQATCHLDIRKGDKVHWL